jgi:hypothetical protein
MIQGRKLKNMRARNIGIWALTRRNTVKYYALEDSKSPATPVSIFLIVPEVV